METRPIALIDAGSAEVATLNVSPADDHFEGSISLANAPEAIRELFAEFEEIVNGQMFALLDDVEEKIAGLRLSVLFQDGTTALVADVQVFPSTRAVSFTVGKELPVLSPRPAKAGR